MAVLLIRAKKADREAAAEVLSRVKPLILRQAHFDADHVAALEAALLDAMLRRRPPVSE